MSFLEKEQELDELKEAIRIAEDEIKEIQSQIMQQRSENSRKKTKKIRKHFKPQTEEIIFDDDIYRGLSEEHYQLLARLRRETLLEQEKIDDIKNKNRLLQNQIDELNEEISLTENNIVDLKSNLFHLSQESGEKKMQQDFSEKQLKEKKIEIHQMSRLSKDAQSAITDLEFRRTISEDDRDDLKPALEQLLRLSNLIRRTDMNIDKLNDQIAILTQELSRMILPEDDKQKEALEILEMPALDELEPDIKRMTEEVASKEKILFQLRHDVKAKHTQSLLLEQKYERIKQIAEENIKPADDLPSASTDELLKQLDNALLTSKADINTLRDEFAKKIESNKEKEDIIQKRIRKIDIIKVVNEKELNKIKGEIKQYRDKSFDDEMKFVERIKFLQQKIKNRESYKKKKPK